MDAAALLQDLIGDGFNIYLNGDGTAIKVDAPGNKITDNVRTTIKENRDAIIAHLQRKAYDPKVARGAIHYILHRSHNRMVQANLTEQQRKECITALEPKLMLVWHALEQHNPYSLRETLKSFNRAVIVAVENAASQPTRIQFSV